MFESRSSIPRIGLAAPKQAMPETIDDSLKVSHRFTATDPQACHNFASSPVFSTRLDVDINSVAHCPLSKWFSRIGNNSTDVFFFNILGYKPPDCVYARVTSSLL